MFNTNTILRCFEASQISFPSDDHTFLELFLHQSLYCSSTKLCKPQFSNKLLSCCSFPSMLMINHCLCRGSVWSIKILGLLLFWINKKHPHSRKMIKPSQLIHQQNNDIILRETAVLSELVIWVNQFSHCFSSFCCPEVSCMLVPSLLCSAAWTCLAKAQLQCEH